MNDTVQEVFSMENKIDQPMPTVFCRNSGIVTMAAVVLLFAASPLPVMAQARTASGQVPAYLADDIVREVAAVVSLKDIMRKAEKAGMKTGDVVAVLIRADVTPSVVIYTAIREGYSAQKVVAAAVKAGVPIGTVVNAALGAGADTKAIYVGAAEAGAMPSEVANALAGASVPAAPVFGYAAPADSSSRGVYTPSTPIMIGCGGGATPSASPYRPKK